MQGDGVTWLAVVHRMVDGGRRGYVLDASPEERPQHLRELGRAVVGEFASRQEATQRSHRRSETEAVAADRHPDGAPFHPRTTIIEQTIDAVIAGYAAVAPTIPLFRGEPTLSVLIRKSLGNKAQDDLKGARLSLTD